MSDNAQHGRTWQARADDAETTRENAALDRLYDDVERYEPTPMIAPETDTATALVGFFCLLAVVCGLIAMTVWRVVA